MSSLSRAKVPQKVHQLDQLTDIFYVCRFKPTQLAHGPCHVTGFHPQLYGGSLRLALACLGKLEIQMQ